MHHTGEAVSQWEVTAAIEHMRRAGGYALRPGLALWLGGRTAMIKVRTSYFR